MGIEELRKRRGLTQLELARKLDVDQSCISRWEHGRTKPLRKIRKKLTEILGCTEDEIFGSEKG